MMERFKDYFGNDVVFTDEPIHVAKHVLVLCRYQGKFLLTIHPERGFEFPGGKIEQGETPMQAAIREVFEETGGKIEQITYIGQYIVNTIIKNVYFATIYDKLEKVQHETIGIVIVDHIPNNVVEMDQFSYIMKDRVLPICLEKISRLDGK